MSPRGALAAFEQLNEQRVRWCLWRGSPRIDESCGGAGDIDILVHPEDVDALRAALTAVGCKRARTAAARTAPGLEDWFGLGGPTGPLQHLHVHERMLTGEPRLYRFRLPWEDEVLQGRRQLKGGPVWTAEATDEAALLLIRSALQVRWRDHAPGSPAIGRLIAKVERDLRAFESETSSADVVARVRSWLGESAALGELERWPRVTPDELKALGGAARRALKEHTSPGAGGAAIEGLRRQLSAGARKLAQGGRGPLLRATRTGPAGARVLAIVGGDQTVARELAATLFELFGAKLDVLKPLEASAGGRGLARARAARELGWTALITAETADELVAESGELGADAVLSLADEGRRELEARAVAWFWDQA